VGGRSVQCYYAVYKHQMHSSTKQHKPILTRREGPGILFEEQHNISSLGEWLKLAKTTFAMPAGSVNNELKNLVLYYPILPLPFVQICLWPQIFI